MENLANKLIELRRAKDMTQEELAEKIGSTQKTISSWEKGRTFPRMKELSLLCEALDCTMETLTGAKTYSISDITFNDLVLRIRSLDLQQLDQLKTIVEETVYAKLEIVNMKKQKEEQEKRLMEYADRIAQLEKRLNELK